jgi:rubrerythrin
MENRDEDEGAPLLSEEELEALSAEFEQIRDRIPAHALLEPPQTPGGFRNLGTTPLARQLGLNDDQLNGHWCSRCQGIWFGYTLEAQCPVCGNRNG